MVLSKNRLIADLLTLLTALLALLLFKTLVPDFFESLVHFSRQHEDWKLDELFFTTMIIGVIFALISLRRWRQLRREFVEHQRTENLLFQERQLLRTLIDSSPDYIFVKDTQGHYTVSNLAHAQAAGVETADTLVGKTAFDFFAPDIAAQFHADDQAVMAQKHALVNLERVTVDRYGNQRAVLTTKVPLLESDGRVSGIVGLTRDITERKEAEQKELELAREKERIKMMTSFVQDAAHDLRTPLAVINTSLYLLQKVDDSDRRQKYVGTIEQQVANLEKMIDGLTTLARLDALNQLNLLPLDLNQLAKQAYTLMQPTAQAKNQTLTFEPDPDIPPVLASESDLLHVLTELIYNAVRYTPVGGVIKLRIRPSDPIAILTITDTGIGISAADLPHIFERFYRADPARSAATGGMGLGLSIAQKIIELHHGNLVVQSLPGQGSTFQLHLPLATSVPVPPLPLPRAERGDLSSRQ